MKNENSNRSAAGDTLMAVMAAIVVPQIVLRAVESAQNGVDIYLAGFFSVISLVLVHFALAWVRHFVPRKLSYEIIATQMGPSAAVIAASARFLSYVLVLVLGIAMAGTGLAAVLPTGDYLRAVMLALVLVLALPALMRRPLGKQFYWVCAAIGIASLAAVLVVGLLKEMTEAYESLDFVMARAEIFASGIADTMAHPRLAVIVAAQFPAALMFLVSERVLAEGKDRRVSPKWLGQRFTTMVVSLLLSFYLIVIFQLPGQRMSIPTLVMADTILGRTGGALVAIGYAITGCGVALAVYSRLPMLLRELALDGVLPRRLASKDALKPRLTIVAITAVFAAALSTTLLSAQAGATIFIVGAFLQLGLTCTAISLKAVAVLKESLDRDERRRASWAKWIFGLFALACGCVIALTAFVWPLVVGIAALSLAVPTLFMFLARRGAVKVAQTIAAEDLTAGRRLPTRVHGVVVVHRVDAPTIRALSYARAHRLSSLRAVTVDFDPTSTERLRSDWEKASIPVDLTVLGNPREATRGHIVDFVHTLHETHPGDIVTVFYPRLLRAGAWEGLVLRRTLPPVVADLRHEPGVILAEVPYLVDLSEDE